MKNTIIFAVLGLAALGAIGYGIMNKNSANDVMMKKEVMEKEAMMQKDAMMKDESMKKEMQSGEMMKDDAMMKKEVMEKETTMKKDTMMVKAGTYETYSPAKVSQATGKIVLFFNASWCPTCRALDKELKENIAKIPAGTTILSVDYDTSKELKKKYEITTQHTLVQVDKTGNKINLWKGGNLDTIITNTK